jgi:hypothetical protein
MHERDTMHISDTICKERASILQNQYFETHRGNGEVEDRSVSPEIVQAIMDWACFWREIEPPSANVNRVEDAWGTYDNARKKAFNAEKKAHRGTDDDNKKEFLTYLKKNDRGKDYVTGSTMHDVERQITAENAVLAEHSKYTSETFMRAIRDAQTALRLSASKEVNQVTSDSLASKFKDNLIKGIKDGSTDVKFVSKFINLVGNDGNSIELSKFHEDNCNELKNYRVNLKKMENTGRLVFTSCFPRLFKSCQFGSVWGYRNADGKGALREIEFKDGEKQDALEYIFMCVYHTPAKSDNLMCDDEDWYQAGGHKTMNGGAGSGSGSSSSTGTPPPPSSSRSGSGSGASSGAGSSDASEVSQRGNPTNIKLPLQKLSERACASLTKFKNPKCDQQLSNGKKKRFNLNNQQFAKYYIHAKSAAAVKQVESNNNIIMELESMDAAMEALASNQNGKITGRDADGRVMYAEDQLFGSKCEGTNFPGTNEECRSMLVDCMIDGDSDGVGKCLDHLGGQEYPQNVDLNDVNINSIRKIFNKLGFYQYTENAPARVMQVGPQLGGGRDRHIVLSVNRWLKEKVVENEALDAPVIKSITTNSTLISLLRQYHSLLQANLDANNKHVKVVSTIDDPSKAYGLLEAVAPIDGDDTVFRMEHHRSLDNIFTVNAPVSGAIYRHEQIGTPMSGVSVQKGLLSQNGGFPGADGPMQLVSTYRPAPFAIKARDIKSKFGIEALEQIIHDSIAQMRVRGKTIKQNDLDQYMLIIKKAKSWRLQVEKLAAKLDAAKNLSSSFEDQELTDELIRKITSKYESSCDNYNRMEDKLWCLIKPIMAEKLNSKTVDKNIKQL